MSLQLRAYDALPVAGSVGWKTNAARIQIYNDGDAQFGANGWKLVKAAWWYEKVLIQEDPPIYNEGWRYIFNYTVPPNAPLAPSLDRVPLDELTYPKNGLAGWTHQSQPYSVEAQFYRSTNGGASYFLADAVGGVSDTTQSITSGAVYDVGDWGYAVIYYMSIDGSVPGPTATSSVLVF